MNHLILIAGHLCLASMFEGQREVFAATHDVITHDLRDGECFDDYVEQLLTLLDERGASSASVCGFSMGGMVAAELAARHPERVERLCLLDSTIEPESPHRAKVRVERLQMAREMGLESLTREVLVPSYLPETAQNNPALVEAIVQMALENGMDVLLRQIEALGGRANRAELLADYPGPVLIMAGEEDRLFKPAVQQRMAEHFRDAELLLLPGVGHFASLEAPVEVNAALAHWLNRPAVRPFE